MLTMTLTPSALWRTAQRVALLARARNDDAQLCAGQLLEQHARDRPQAIAIKSGDQRYTWAQFNHEANRVAAAFRARGLTPGDCVALAVETSPEALFLLLGLNKLGVVAAMVNTQLTGDALLHVLRIATPREVVCDAEHLEAVSAACVVLRAETGRPLSLLSLGEDCAESGPDGRAEGATVDSVLPAPTDGAVRNPPETGQHRARDLMMYLYTSGTTGLPKAALIRNQRFMTMASAFGLISGTREDDVIYLTLPIYHATGAIGALGAMLVSGCAIALRRRFSAREFWSDCVRYEATLFNYIGEICRYLLNAPAHPLERAHRLRAALGAGLRADIWTPFQTRFGVPRIIEFYGATEGNIGLINLENKPGMMGRLMPGQALARIDEVSEAFLRNARGHLVRAKAGEKGILLGRITRSTRFDGYLDSRRNRDKILDDPFGDGCDYFNSGDLAQLHPGRWVSFADRLGDTYRWKGENLSTIEVSNLLNACGGVLESTVYGVNVAGHDGRAGMAVLVTAADFDLAVFNADVVRCLPDLLRPVFLRQQTQIATTASFKYVKTALQADGFDPSALTDPLFVLRSDRQGYEALTPALHAAIVDGSRRL